MTLKTASIKDVENDVTGMKVLVTRTYPRWIGSGKFDFWFRELSPSYELLTHWKENHDVEYYKKTFFEQISSSFDAQDKIRLLNKLSKERDVTLFCYEPEGQFCHRHLLVDMINSDTSISFCPFLLKGDAKLRCGIKFSSSSGLNKSALANVKKLGHPEMCDFYGQISGNRLFECVLFVSKTKFFTCRTCIFNYEDYKCLQGKVFKNVLSSMCDCYVENMLRLGNRYLVRKIKENSEYVNELKLKLGIKISVNKGGKRLRVLTYEEMKKVVDSHPEIRKVKGMVVVLDVHI